MTKMSPSSRDDPANADTRVVDVDWTGRDLAGNRYDLIAAKAKVRAGYLINMPVLLRYPDRSLRKGNELRVTAKGLDELKRQLPVSDRQPSGTA